MAKDYHKILGIPKGASEQEIKKAYRKKAKLYHPDRNNHHLAAEAFILVNEAYEMLLNPVSVKKNQVDEAKRRRYYGTSKAGAGDFESRREEARKRAQENAKRSYEEFTRSPLYKTAMVIDQFFNYMVIALGILIICSPIISLQYIPEEDLEEYPYWTLIFPIAIGFGFIYGIYYYAIKAND